MTVSVSVSVPVFVGRSVYLTVCGSVPVSESV